MEVEFNQRRYFSYMSGVSEADCALLYHIETDSLTLYVPDFDFKKAIWTGSTLTPDDAMVKYNFDQVKYASSLEKDLAEWAKSSSTPTIYALHKSHLPPVDHVIQKVNVDTVSLLLAMNAARTIKDDHEIALIKKAIAVSTAGHIAVLRNISRMKNEREIHGLFLDTCISLGSFRQSYGIIAGSGSNAAILHYMTNDDTLEGKELVLLDAGAEWNVYASDVTRTFPRFGVWPSQQSKEIYSLVQKMQEECISRIRPGVRFLDLQVMAHSIAIEGLLKLGILKTQGSATAEDIRKSGASAVFFPHGLGHHVGLEVHDVSDRPTNAAVAASMEYSNTHPDMFTSNSQPATRLAPLLAENLVVTVEPGIYFSRVAIDFSKKGQAAKFIDYDVLDKYMRVGGVRIEDDILVTKNGYENLTHTPKGENAMKIIREAMRERGGVV
ncbi:hypothetical protein KEM56_000698 [Ascosphaera pollenicola]|nr:hypothetical protein KEM56_000698 [Ascosphaera pollenicola]